MSSRKIEDCTPELQEKHHAFAAAMAAAGLPFMLTCTARTVREQIALYAQGREKLDQVNALRKIAGLSPITFQENSRKVTWTLASKHIIDLEDNIPENDKSRAFDIAILRDDRPTWNLKVNVNKNDIPDYDEAGRIGEAVGLRWGGRFPSPDRPHFEV
jgi:peptidoglycan L-alanyl-D-glutamate endopeptidase CwlK